MGVWRNKHRERFRDNNPSGNYEESQIIKMIQRNFGNLSNIVHENERETTPVMNNSLTRLGTSAFVSRNIARNRRDGRVNES